MKPLQFTFFSLIISFFASSSSISAQCDMDTIPPSALVVSLSTAVLGAQSNQVELYAIDFFVFENDNCDPEDSLRYTFSSTLPENDNKYKEEFRSSTKLYDCYDAEHSPIAVDVYVWDLSGNYFTSVVNLTLVQPNDMNCDACIMDTIPPEVTFGSTLYWAYPIDEDSVEIWASDFVLSATDECTSKELLKYSFTPVSPNEDPSSAFKYFYCEDAANSPLSVDIYVWDRDGNYTMGTASLSLQLPSGYDCPPSFQDISGTVINLKGEPIEGANVNLHGESEEVLDNTITNELGEYFFNYDPTNKYLSVTYDDDSDPEVTFLDMVAVQHHLLGLNTFSIPQQIAADINTDGRLRVNDLKMMRKMILGINNPNDQINKEWKFVNQDQDIIQENIENHFPLNGTEGPTIVGYRIGDVN